MAARDLETRSSSRFAVLWLTLAVVGAASMVYYHLGLFIPRVEKAQAAKHLAGEYSFGNDFYPIWLTSRQWLRERRDPYSPELTREIQIGLLGRPLDSQFPTDPPSDYRAFAYPAFTDLLLWPVSEIPFRTLRIMWVALLTVLLAAAIVFWVRALSWHVSGVSLAIMLLFTLCSYQELEGLYAGQLGLLVGFLLAASVLALLRDRPLLAGTLLALAMIKPQMVLLAVSYLFLWSAHDWRRRRRFVVAFLATMFLLISASLAVWPRWIQSWGRVILGYPRYSTPPLAKEVLGSSLGGHAGTPLIALLVIAALVLAWRGRAAAAGSYEFWLSLSALLALTTITLLPGQSVCDHVILLPGIFLLACRNESHNSTRTFRALFGIGAAVLLWPWLAAVGLVVLRPFLRPELFYSKALFALPLRTAAAFPFVVLGLLALALRGARAARETTGLPARG
jgi:Glycosyltransferase family 87